MPQALAAVDLALWDRAGRRAGGPVGVLLATGWCAIRVNATVGAEDRPRRAERRPPRAAAGFAGLKVKVGVGDDAGRLAAVRAAVGPQVAIRVDANGAWGSVDEAVANLSASHRRGIELAEEPVHGVEALRAVRELAVRIAMDETPRERRRGQRRGRRRVPEGQPLRRHLRRAAGRGPSRAASSQVYLASTFDGPLGIAAGLHAAAGLRASGPGRLLRARRRCAPSRTTTACSRRSDGAIAVPEGPGLLGTPR